MSVAASRGKPWTAPRRGAAAPPSIMSHGQNPDAWGLVLNEAVTARVRLRRWRHRGLEAPEWPVTAHDTVEIAWAEAGAMRYRIGRQELHASPGEVVVVPAGQEHHTAIEPGTAATSIQISHTVIAETRQLIGGSIDFGVIRDRAIVSLAELMLEEACGGQRGSFLTTDALAEALSVRLLRTGDTRSVPVGTDPRIARALDEVEARFAEPLTIDELAASASMSRHHFSRTFRKQMGKSPYQFLMATRVRRAAELLRKRHSVTEAAFSVGVFDLGRFARAFRKEMGCTPSQYAEARTA